MRWATREHDLIVAAWPRADARAIDPAAKADIDWLIRLVTGIRAARTELNVPPGARLRLSVRDGGPETMRRLAPRRRPLAAAGAGRFG
jgi:valyl-tRNA synthetase